MSKQITIYAASVVAALSLLVGCSSTPTEVPTETVVPTATPAPTESPSDTPAPTPTKEPPRAALPFQEGFEDGLGSWQKGSDVPEDPERPGEPVAWSIEASAEQAAEGSSSARFTIDGKQDDGTIWLARPFIVDADETVAVRLAFDLWSASESFNTLARVVAYAGLHPPSAEGDFDASQAANLVEGWKTYEYTFQVPTDDQGQVWVALGISAVWETEMTYYVDDVRVNVGPAEEGQPSGGSISITGVGDSAERVVVRGTSSLPDGAMVCAELWADGALLPWWPEDACSPVQDGAWELVVPLGPGQELQPDVQYMVRAFHPGGPNVVSTFPFDVAGPPTPPSEPQGDPTLLLPESAEPIHRASSDLDGDGTAEEVILTGWGGGPNRLGYDFLQLFVIAFDGGEYVIAWQSEQLPTDRGEALEARDVNGDGLPEVLSGQAVGASGEMLYVLGWQDGGYGFLSPHGGHFEAEASFGENGVRLEDLDGDGLDEILASYGPAAQSTDVYGWDGEAYVYRETLGASDTSYEREMVAEAGLSLEVPRGWTQVEPGVWAAPDDEDLRLGVQWADLEPPEQPEAVLLPKPAQTLDSRPVELAWGSGRWFTVQVYGQAVEGEGQAPVQSVQNHVLIVLQQDGCRRAIDVFAAAPNGEQLAGLDGVFRRAMTSVVLR